MSGFIHISHLQAIIAALFRNMKKTFVLVDMRWLWPDEVIVGNTSRQTAADG